METSSYLLIVAIILLLIASSGVFLLWKNNKEKTQALAESEERYKNLANATFEGIVIHDKNVVLEVNAKTVEMLGYNNCSELIGKTVLSFFPPIELAKIKNNFIIDYDGAYETKLIKLDGNTIEVEILGKTLFYKEEMVRVAAIRDITERRIAARVIEQSEERLAMALEISEVGVFDYTLPSENKSYFSEQWANTLGYVIDELPPADRIIPWWLSHIHSEDKLKVSKAYFNLIKGKMDKYNVEYRQKDRDGNWLYLVVYVNVINRDSNGIATRIIGAIVDITKQKQIEESLRRAKEEVEKANNRLKKEKQHFKRKSITDELTQIYNHRYIVNKLTEETKRAERYNNQLSIIMIDIDYFKQVNDNYGHLFGDKVLRRISQTIKDNIRETDFVGRYGGEEFLIILPETDYNHSFKLAERIRKKVEAIEWGKDNLVITLSAGIAELNNEEEAQILRRADDLLYEAKNKGRNRVV